MSGIGKLGARLLGIILGSAYAFSASSATAQITPDRTLPTNSNVTINGSIFNITGGTQAGRNLFHSFQQFSIPTGGTASFNNGLDIQNIISRVTGGEVSNIDGLIKALGTANLFFLNPNGIVFGPHASLDVGGSFVATTADAIQFGFQGSFSASAPNNPALLTVDPSALLFNQIAASPIQNNSMAPAGTNPSGELASGLRVRDGKSLLLVGGDINLDRGNLNAFSGHVDLGGLAGSGTLGLNVDGNMMNLSFPDGVERASVSLKNSSINVSGSGSGSIAINARNLDLQQSSLKADISQSSDTPSLRAGDININAVQTIKIVGQSSQIESSVLSNATGNGSNINISTGSLSIMDGSEINTFTSGQGNAGNVKINARDTVSFDGIASNGDASGIVSIVTKGANGNGGNISINTGTLSLTNGGIVLANTNGQGSTGSVTIFARDTVSLDGQGSNGEKSNVSNLVNLDGIGNSGGISITTRTLSLKNGAQLNTSTDGMGNAGNVMIEASDRVWFNQGSVFTSVNQTAIGKGGNISIKSGDISLANGSLIILATNGQGDAGHALLTTRSLSLTDGSLLTTVSDNSASKAGTIMIKATESVSLSGHSPMTGRSTEISSDTVDTATGRGGNITIDTTAFRLSDGAIINARTTSNGTGGSITINSKTFEAINGGELISTTTRSASAGKITVNATDWVSVNGRDPTVDERRRSIFKKSGGNLANVEAASGFFVRSSGSGSAGDIEVNSPQIRLDNAGKFSAESTSGNGGNIKVLARDLLLLRRGSQISATAGTNQFGGNGGNITINTPSGVVAGVRSENSNITANAYEGSGGFINITARGVFGLQRSNQLTLFSDITAFSQQNPQLNGVVQLNVSDVDPSSGLVVLPTSLIDASSRLKDASCAALNSNEGNKFVVTGRSGLPPSPDEPLTSDVVWTDARLPVTTGQHQHKTHASKPKPQPIAIIPATGWVLNDKGEVMLISSAANATSVNTPTSCPVR